MDRSPIIPTMVVGDCYGSLLRQTIPETLKCSIKTATNDFLIVTADCYGKRHFSPFSDMADSTVENDPNTDDMTGVRSRASRLFGEVSIDPDTKTDQAHCRNTTKRIGLIFRGKSFYVRLHIPRALHQVIGRKEIVRSLRTSKLRDAISQARIVSADFESWLCTSVSQMSAGAPISEPPQAAAPTQSSPLFPHLQPVAANIGQAQAHMSLRDLFDIFIKDPSKFRSEKAIWGYQNAVELAEDVLGKEISIGAIDRQCGRKVLEIARGIPLNFKKRFPNLSYKRAAAKAKAENLKLIQPKTINDHLIKLSTLMNFAVTEGYLSRNPFRGLRVADNVHPRDKRYPFSDQQLWQLFNAPLYRGCINDDAGYDKCGPEHPRRGRFWIPLIALFGGLRLNEACQLDVGDVKTLEGILCFSVSAESVTGDKDKKLKTKSSVRIVPVHKQLMEIGFGSYVEEQRRNGNLKLFPERRCPRDLIQFKVSSGLKRGPENEAKPIYRRTDHIDFEGARIRCSGV